MTKMLPFSYLFLNRAYQTVIKTCNFAHTPAQLNANILVIFRIIISSLKTGHKTSAKTPSCKYLKLSYRLDVILTNNCIIKGLSHFCSLLKSYTQNYVHTHPHSTSSSPCAGSKTLLDEQAIAKVTQVEREWNSSTMHFYVKYTSF